MTLIKHTHKKKTYSFSSLYSPLKAWMETARMQLSWRNLRKKKKNNQQFGQQLVVL